jgi:hypothetical protein
MRVLITACTEKIFSKQPVPLGHLTCGEVRAVNDNELGRLVSPAGLPLPPSAKWPRVPCCAVSCSEASEEAAEGSILFQAYISGWRITEAIATQPVLA